MFSPKQCVHTEGVLTVSDKARCSIEVVSEASGIFPVNFHTKCLLWNVHVHFDCAGLHKTLAPGLASGSFPVNFHRLPLVTCPCAFRLHRLAQSVLPGLGVSLPPQLHHLLPPQHPHHHLPFIFLSSSFHLPFIIIIIIIIIFIIIINIIIHDLFTPPTLFGVSCRDNLFPCPTKTIENPFGDGSKPGYLLL